MRAQTAKSTRTEYPNPFRPPICLFIWYMTIKEEGRRKKKETVKSQFTVFWI